MMPRMIGTALNAAGIAIGGAVGLIRRKPLSPANEAFFKVTIGAFTVFYGLRLTWLSLGGSFAHVLKQLAVVILALMAGKLTGRLLRLQALSNRVGQSARALMASAKPADPQRFNYGFRVCTALFCAAPIGWLGAVQD